MNKNYIKNNIFEQNTLHQYYCAAQLHDKMEINSEFDRDAWPHHTTLAGVFTINSADILDSFEKIAKNTLPLSSTIIGYDTFGYNEEKARVALLLKTPELAQLSNSLVNALKHEGSAFKQPTFLGDNYRPHITDHGDLARFAIGTSVLFDQLSLVDLAPDGDKTRRRVVWQSPSQAVI